MRRFFSFSRDLGLQLLALYLLFVIPVVVAALVFEYLSSQRLEADVKAADLSLARAIAQETNTTMENAMQAVAQLSTYPEVIKADAAGMETVFGTLMSVRRDVNLIYRLDKDGIMLFHYPLGPGSTLGVDFSFRDYFQRARTSKTPLLSKGRISPTTNQAVATAVMPLWSKTGEFEGLVATNIKLQSLSHTLASIAREHHPEEGFQILIVDHAGQIIAHSDPAMLLEDASENMPEVVAQVLSSRTGNLIAQADNGEESLYSYVPVYSAGWGVIVSRPTSAAFVTPIIFQRGILIAIGVFLLGGLFFWIALSRRVITPLERMAAFSQVIGQDQDFAQDQSQQIESLAARADQIGNLTRSLKRMQEAIQARLNELSTLLRTSAAVVSTLDSPTVLDRILEQMERLLDIQMCAVVALDEQEGKFRVQASRGLSQWYTEHTVIDPDEPSSVTMRAIRSGEPIQVSDTEANPSFTWRRSRARAAGYRSVLAVPLLVQHAPPSALLVFRPTPHVFSRREINLLTSFANHAAMAIQNATLYARSDMRLEEQTRRLEALIQSMQDGLILEDLQGRVRYANRRIQEIANLKEDEIRDAEVSFVMEKILDRAKDKAAALEAIQRAVDGHDSRRAEFPVAFPDKTRYLRMKVFDVTDSQGTLIGRGRILQDVTQHYEVDRMKSSLVSTVSHELRTPLAAIKGYATTLLAEDVQWDVQSQREFLTIISDETDHLSNLVNDLLDMSRIEAGNLTVSRVECDLKELIVQAASRSLPQPGNRLQVDLPEEMPFIFADPKRIEVVLRNLIENATKYSEGSVLVQGELKDGQLIVRVKDSGPGIPADQTAHIFESFYRVESGLTRNTAGAGLGLAISQGFVRAHGGEIWIESDQPGACVAFSLPLNNRRPDTL